MNPADILPFVTGSGGALFTLLIGYALLLSGSIVSGREHRAALADKAKLEAANDILRTTLQSAQDQNTQLASSTQVTVQLMSVLENLARERRTP